MCLNPWNPHQGSSNVSWNLNMHYASAFHKPWQSAETRCQTIQVWSSISTSLLHKVLIFFSFSNLHFIANKCVVLTWGPKSQVQLTLASTNMKAKSQLLNLKKLLNLVSIHSIQLLIILCKFSGLVLRVGSSLLLNLTLNASPEPHLQEALSCKHPCHTLDHVWSGKS